MRIESGCPKGELIRAYLTALIVCGLSAYFFYDGYIGYPKENLEWAIENFPEEPETPPAIKPIVTSATHAEVEAKVKEGATLEDVTTMLGTPSYQTAEQHWHVGPGGYIELKLSGSRIVETGYIKADHSEAQLLLQKVLGLICLPIGLYLIFKAVKLAGQKYVLDDNGLSCSGQPTVSWDAMTGLNISKYAGKGCVDVEHSGGSPVKLDGYRIEKFDEIVKTICEKKDFESPFGSAGETETSA